MTIKELEKELLKSNQKNLKFVLFCATIQPRNIGGVSMKKIDENYKFRRFLKNHISDGEEFDKTVNELHKKYFKKFDCNKCRNCCKEFYIDFTQEEVKKAANTLNCTSDTLIEKYLEYNQLKNKYMTTTKPCPFLQKNHCILGNNRPRECKEYPHTNKKERLYSLYSMVDNTTVCPVVDKIFDELKTIYHFKVK